ncbi:cytochrome oxidase maturation protein, cbb3-type [Pelobium manganitolerans]|uniref:Cytochrome oxidase maturation protein, cbb3-type n=1 Tax=Pelobium manganitolerans TaxID=1842495 RepID=A0A419S4H2_9SPHI|nr:cbb3-type cytochrome oxidase assembly protein CcoS [Pelobium manganitolerans]RKD14405.1 cytochrome oxidase maturation protein, cbb3-type [Pelobium manganitolerans]
MTIIFFLIACSVVLALCFLAAFFWSHHSGQNKDLYTPSVRILFENEAEEKPEGTKKEEQKAEKL